VETSRYDPELHEPARLGDIHDLQAEIRELHARIDRLLDAVEIIARDHYRPLGLPEGKVSSALRSARRTRPIAIVRLDD
jgi:hypothetical protein